jgi:hypothetical protein
VFEQDLALYLRRLDASRRHLISWRDLFADTQLTLAGLQAMVEQLTHSIAKHTGCDYEGWIIPIEAGLSRFCESRGIAFEGPIWDATYVYMDHFEDYVRPGRELVESQAVFVAQALLEALRPDS